jgi:hypothetical protein
LGLWNKDTNVKYSLEIVCLNYSGEWVSEWVIEGCILVVGWVSYWVKCWIRNWFSWYVGDWDVLSVVSEWVNEEWVSCYLGRAVMWSKVWKLVDCYLYSLVHQRLYFLKL